MALTNAERQKRHRDRQKEALRNVEGTGLSLPEVLALQFKRNVEAEGGGEDLVRQYTAENMEGVLRALGLHNIELCWMDECPELVSVLGGREYIASLDKWHEERMASREAHREARHEWEKAVKAWSRKKDKGPMPLEPVAPLPKEAPALRLDARPGVSLHNEMPEPPPDTRPAEPVIPVDRTSYVAPDDAW